MNPRPGLSALLALSLVACGGVDRQTAGEPAPSFGDRTPPPMRVLVIGGTSGIGLETVKLALARGHEVSAMARRPERMTLTHARLRTIKGDITHPDAVSAAVDGHDAVVSTIGIGPTRKSVTVFSTGMKNVLAAMDEHGVARLIAVTGIGAGDSRGHGGLVYDVFTRPVLPKTIYADKDREEELIRASDTDWTIVRPGFLEDGPSRAQYRVIQDLAGISAGDIDRADVAHFIVYALESGRYVGTTPLLTN